MKPQLNLRDMYEVYLTSQCHSVRVPVEGDRHCWLVEEKRVETRHAYDWLGKSLGVQSVVIAADRYVWLGSKGAVTITKDPVFNKRKNVETSLHLDMKRWVLNTYYGTRLRGI